MARGSRFNVAPRYSGGSPALVPEAIARRVAEEEREGYRRALEGFYGESAQLGAEKDGLAGIVEERVETSRGWKVRDLLTGATFLRPFRPREGDAVSFVWADGVRREGRLRGRYIYSASGTYAKKDCDDLRALPVPIPPESF